MSGVRVACSLWGSLCCLLFVDDAMVCSHLGCDVKLKFTIVNLLYENRKQKFDFPKLSSYVLCSVHV